jgi:hypothetical protein
MERKGPAQVPDSRLFPPVFPHFAERVLHGPFNRRSPAEI